MSLFQKILNGLLQFIDSILGTVVDGLSELVDAFGDKLEDIVDQALSFTGDIPDIFDGFLDSLDGLFPFLPEGAINLIIVGLCLIAFIGIIKLVRR